MNQSLDQQNVLTLDRQLMAEVDFEQRRLAMLRLLVTRLDERADNGHLESTHQIADEHEAVFQNAQGDHGLALIVVGNLARKFADSFLNLIGRDELAQGSI